MQLQGVPNLSPYQQKMAERQLFAMNNPVLQGDAARLMMEENANARAQIPQQNPWTQLARTPASPMPQTPQPMQENITPQATRMPPFEPSQLLMNQLEKKYQESINSRMGDIGNREALIQGMAQTYKPQLDLSPLLAYAQSKTGTNLTAGYKSPESPQERVSKVLALQQGLEQQKRGITQDEMGLLRAKLSNELAKTKTDAKAGLSGLGGEEKKMVGLIQEGRNAIEGMSQALKNNIMPSRLTPDSPLIGTFVSDNAFTANQRLAAEYFGRIQSGGAINKDEEKRFIQMGPRAGDLKEVAEKKLAAQKLAFDNRLKIYGVTEEMLSASGIQSKSSVPSANQGTVSFNGKNLPSGLSEADFYKSMGL